MTNEILAGEPGAGERREGRVLVVDDSRVIRATVGGMLRNVGYTVVEAENGREAIALLGGLPFDVVITDLHMPEADGFAVLEAVRALSPLTEVVIFTGTHARDVNAAVRALRLGAHDFLTKPPAGPHEVIVTVDRAIEKRRLQQANLRLLHEMEGLSRTDSLTGVWNRRAFEETMHREVLRASRYGLPLSLVLVDIDRFQQVNDTFSQQVGDEVLRWFALHVSRVLREGDTIHRYAGGTFAILLPHSDEDGAHFAATRVLEHVRSAPFQSTLRVTASAGVASGTGVALDELDLVALAEAALVQAKRSGRNRVVAYGPDADQALATLTAAREVPLDVWTRRESPAGMAGLALQH